MRNINELKDSDWIAFGNHPGVIQSTIDFDYLIGRKHPSIKAIVGSNHKVSRYFFGNQEIIIPGYMSLCEVPESIRNRTELIGVMQSSRRILESVTDSIEFMPKLSAGFIFAEGVTEKDALKLREMATKNNFLLIGPASVGMIFGGRFKLGAIAGTTLLQISETATIEPGNIAVISTSGGIINEIITTVANSGGRIGYAVSIGGERFPITKPVTIFEQALKDKAITAIVYFGEVGGSDEYEIAEAYKKTKYRKPCVCYIAGTIAEQFDTPQQFGHAKAMAHGPSETSSEKIKALTEAGILVSKTFGNFETSIKKLSKNPQSLKNRQILPVSRKTAIFVDRISKEDDNGDVKILGEKLLDYIQDRSLSRIALEMFLNKKELSNELTEFFDVILRLLVDHGPQVSGAVNVMISARAGKDIASSLASGILTIGPRFGGAINVSATNWFTAVNNNVDPHDFVEQFASRKEYIAGIGHRKYSIDFPDPRVVFLLETFDKGGRYTKFAQNVAEITVSKKGRLILNVDGIVAALLLDILEVKESMSPQEINDLINTEFFNAIFILSRSVGFIAHYLEQRRLDEGLFRLPSDLVLSTDD